MDGSDPIILIVDDDRSTRYVLKRLLGPRGWKIITASTVAEAIELLRFAPACVILDLILPDGCGERVLRRIREGGLSSRVIVSTGTTDEAMLEVVRRLSPDAIVRKPVEMKQLLQACSV